MKRPNVVIVFADQLRRQATGFGGDPNVWTPNLDALAGRSLNFTTAVSGCSVCSPARASLLTGQYPHTHGVFVNDVCLRNGAASIAEALASEGYDTAYVGKWHLDGHGRSAYIPPERRHGFEGFQALECTHAYNESPYYDGDDEKKRIWDGYDAIAQTRAAREYIQGHDASRPFLLVLSWGPPHNPYQTAPERFRRRYDPEGIILRPNVPPECEQKAREDLAGYYAHVSALDEMVGDLRRTVRETGIEDDTIFVFWSDHGDMLGSQGEQRKQRPWDESILVPLLIRYPRRFGDTGRRIDAVINTPDLMPTLLGMCGAACPDTVEGTDYTPFLKGEAPAPADAALIACYHPFGEYTRGRSGGREYRGVRTRRHTYVRDLEGAWLLYDHVSDPFQQHNLVGERLSAALQQQLDARTQALLADLGDEFLPGEAYIERWEYETDETGTVPYTL